MRYALDSGSLYAVSAIEVYICSFGSVCIYILLLLCELHRGITSSDFPSKKCVCIYSGNKKTRKEYFSVWRVLKWRKTKNKTERKLIGAVWRCAHCIFSKENKKGFIDWRISTTPRPALNGREENNLRTEIQRPDDLKANIFTDNIVCVWKKVDRIAVKHMHDRYVIRRD